VNYDDLSINNKPARAHHRKLASVWPWKFGEWFCFMNFNARPAVLD